MKAALLAPILLFSLLLLSSCFSSKPTIKIGLNVEATGEVPAVGKSTINAAKLFVYQINSSGGIDLRGEKIPLELVIGDNESKPEEAVAVARRLIAQDKVIAMIGPNVSSCSIPASEIAESSGCLMISPWSTNPHTTRSSHDSEDSFKKNVFRSCFTEIQEAPILAHFALQELHAHRAAILYDMSSESPSSAAHQFEESFRKLGGTLVAAETYTTGDRDFSTQLTKIKSVHPDLLFIPAYYNDVPLIAQQARRLGISAQFLGYNSWSTPEIIQLDVEHCLENACFSNHFSPTSSLPAAKKFVTLYEKTYDQPPDDIAALTYDAMLLLSEAIVRAGSSNRLSVREAMSRIENFSGVTGDFYYCQGSHDPLKSLVIFTIKDGSFVPRIMMKPHW